MLYIRRVADEWLPISVALVASTLAGLAVTALVLKAMTGKEENAREKGTP